MNFLPVTVVPLMGLPMSVGYFYVLKLTSPLCRHFNPRVQIRNKHVTIVRGDPNLE